MKVSAEHITPEAFREQKAFGVNITHQKDMVFKLEHRIVPGASIPPYMVGFTIDPDLTNEDYIYLYKNVDLSMIPMKDLVQQEAIDKLIGRIDSIKYCCEVDRTHYNYPEGFVPMDDPIDEPSKLTIVEMVSPNSLLIFPGNVVEFYAFKDLIIEHIYRGSCIWDWLMIHRIDQMYLAEDTQGNQVMIYTASDGTTIRKQMNQYWYLQVHEGDEPIFHATTLNAFFYTLSIFYGQHKLFPLDEEDLLWELPTPQMHLSV